jgi:hypothetical protein
MIKVFNTDEKIKKWNVWLKIIGTIITVLGFVIIIFQLKEFINQNESLQRQTELLKQSLIQTYRPIGVVVYYPPDKDVDKYEYLKIDGNINPKTFEGTANIVFSPFLSNKGNGVLVYIGHIYFISDIEYSFRKRLLEGLLNPSEVILIGITVELDKRHCFRMKVLEEYL